MLDPAPEPSSPIPVPDASGSADRRPPQTLIHPVQRVGALLEVLLCSGFPTQVLLHQVLTTFGIPVQTSSGELVLVGVFTLSMLDAALLIGLVFFFLRAHRESPRAVLLGQRPVWRETLVGLLLIPTVLVLIIVTVALIRQYLPGLHNVDRTPFDSLLRTRADAFVFAIVAVVAGVVREEIQRAFILRRFDQYLGGGWVGIVAFSVVFGMGHALQGNDAAIATGLLGAVWGGVYLVRGSVVAPMVSHAGFNLAQLVSYLVSGGRV